uniref:Uncharacterized protein n=1 Tax=Panagrolaimus sp. ES5 TaxID=591445 RepID=A0AC34GHB1_9BILA
LDQPNPDVEAAIAMRSHDVGTIEADTTFNSQAPLPTSSSGTTTSKEKYNPIIKKQLLTLPNLGEGDVKKLMSCFKTPQNLFISDLSELSDTWENPGVFMQFFE